MQEKSGITFFQVDAFTSDLFKGNPAGVCILNRWLPDNIMQNIAMENNLAETAFLVRENEGFRIRWFTPAAEVNLCGHATLASAHVLYHHLGYQKSEIQFESKSGRLLVTKNEDILTLNFPEDIGVVVTLPTELESAFDKIPMTVLKGSTDYVFVYDSENTIKNIVPNLTQIAKAESRGIIITAPGNRVDFVSRYFAPQYGIPEDPVTGSAHTVLTPYWTDKLKKPVLKALQISPRTGELRCEWKNGRVYISGQAITYLEGKLTISEP